MDRRASNDTDEPFDVPPALAWSAAAGIGPLPFLAIYAVIFLVRGLFYPVSPPDITGSRAGEAVAGVVAAILFVLVALSIRWFVRGRRRWPFVVGQSATLATALGFILDSRTGSPAVPVLLVLTSLVALGLAFAPRLGALLAGPRSAGETYVGRRRVERARDEDAEQSEQ